MTAWTTTARSAARLQPVKEELMWLKVLRGCASRSISLNAFFTHGSLDDRECDLLAKRLMAAPRFVTNLLDIVVDSLSKAPSLWVLWQGELIVLL